MKRVLEKSEFDGIQEPLKTLYKESDGKYVLELEDYQEPQELLDAKRRETAEASRLKLELEKMTSAQKKAEKDAENAKKKAIQDEQDRAKSVLDKYIEKLDNLEKNNTEKEARYKMKAEKQALQKGVSDLKEFFLDSEREIMAPYLEKNLSVEWVDDEPRYAYNDDLGNKITELSKIKKILFADEKLKSRIKGVESNGGGASRINSPSRAVPVITDLSKASDQDLLDLAESDPEAFIALTKKKSHK